MYCANNQNCIMSCFLFLWGMIAREMELSSRNLKACLWFLGEELRGDREEPFLFTSRRLVRPPTPSALPTLSAAEQPQTLSINAHEIGLCSSEVQKHLETPQSLQERLMPNPHTAQRALCPARPLLTHSHAHVRQRAWEDHRKERSWPLDNNFPAESII